MQSWQILRIFQYANDLSDCPRDLEINCSDSGSDIFLKDSCESEIKPAKVNVLESDNESDFVDEWIKSDITPTLKDYWNMYFGCICPT